MVNLKIVVGGAVTGLIISFISGIAGGVGIVTVLIRALISALVCGGIGSGVSYVFKRFLDVGEVVSEVPQSQRPAMTGTAVNISVGDDPLPDSENAPEFFVASSDTAAAAPEPMRATDNVRTDVPPTASAGFAADAVTGSENTRAAVQSVQEAPKFVPSSLGSITSSQNSNARAASSPRTAPVERSSSASAGAESLGGMFGELDAMPEIEDIVSSIDEPHDPGPMLQDSGSGADSGVIEDSSFSEMGGQSSSSPALEIDVGTDASLMAQAIRTLLKSDG